MAGGIACGGRCAMHGTWDRWECAQEAGRFLPDSDVHIEGSLHYSATSQDGSKEVLPYCPRALAPPIRSTNISLPHMQIYCRN